MVFSRFRKRLEIKKTRLVQGAGGAESPPGELLGQVKATPCPLPGSKSLVFPRENKISVSGEKVLHQPGGPGAAGRERMRRTRTTLGSGAARLKRIRFLSKSEFQSKNTTARLHTAGQDLRLSDI